MDISVANVPEHGVQRNQAQEHLLTILLSGVLPKSFAHSLLLTCIGRGVCGLRPRPGLCLEDIAYRVSNELIDDWDGVANLLFHLGGIFGDITEVLECFSGLRRAPLPSRPCRK